MNEQTFEQAGKNPETIKNFNDEIWVKVTPSGERVREEYYKRLDMQTPALNRDAEGWTRMQIHEVAHLFGSEMHTGIGDFPVETMFRTKSHSTRPTRPQNPQK